MVTYYNEGDTLSFGRYLLSKGREESLKQTCTEVPDSEPYEVRKRLTTDADFANWKYFTVTKRHHNKDCAYRKLNHPADGKCDCSIKGDKFDLSK